jgi:hypothetical protein
LLKSIGYDNEARRAKASESAARTSGWLNGASQALTSIYGGMGGGYGK